MRIEWCDLVDMIEIENVGLVVVSSFIQSAYSKPDLLAHTEKAKPFLKTKDSRNLTFISCTIS